MLTVTWDPPRATHEQIEEHVGNHTGLAFVDRARARLSRLLCDQLVHGIITRTLDSFRVTDVIQALEMPDRARGRVKVRPFNHPPLRGLLHAHFVQASFIAKNLELELRRPDSLILVREAFGSSDVLDEQTIARWADAMTFGLYGKRACLDAMTGEWLIYANHGGYNFYLAVARHSRNPEEDRVIYDRIMDRCEDSFRKILIAATSQE
jgi:hypothetical protein